MFHSKSIKHCAKSGTALAAPRIRSDAYNDVWWWWWWWWWWRRRRQCYVILKLKKKKTRHLYSAFCKNSPLRSEWHVLTRDHTFLPNTHKFIHEWNEPSGLYSPAAAHHHTLAGTHFPPRRGNEAELAWVAWLVIYRDGMPAHPSIPTRLIVWRPGIELTNIESQVWTP